MCCSVWFVQRMLKEETCIMPGNNIAAVCRTGLRRVGSPSNQYSLNICSTFISGDREKLIFYTNCICISLY
jgi:hypothetical protein